MAPSFLVAEVRFTLLRPDAGLGGCHGPIDAGVRGDVSRKPGANSPSVLAVLRLGPQLSGWAATMFWVALGCFSNCQGTVKMREYR